MAKIKLKLQKETLVDFCNLNNLNKLLKRKVGRPVTKPNRVKIGLSISGESNKILTSLATNGRTKSKVAEEAIGLYMKILEVK